MRFLRFLKALMIAISQGVACVALLMAVCGGGAFVTLWTIGWVAIACGMPAPSPEGMPELGAGFVILILLGGVGIVCIIAHAIYTGVKHVWEDSK
jgi:hypothetical protein